MIKSINLYDQFMLTSDCDDMKKGDTIRIIQIQNNKPPDFSDGNQFYKYQCIARPNKKDWFSDVSIFYTRLYPELTARNKRIIQIY